MSEQVIVIGGGLAGLSAAHTVLEHGCRVLLLDKSPFLGGNSTKATSGINGALTKTQAAKGIQDSADKFEQDCLKGAAGVGHTTPPAHTVPLAKARRSSAAASRYLIVTLSRGLSPETSPTRSVPLLSPSRRARLRFSRKEAAAPWTGSRTSSSSTCRSSPSSVRETPLAPLALPRTLEIRRRFFTRARFSGSKKRIKRATGTIWRLTTPNERTLTHSPRSLPPSPPQAATPTPARTEAKSASPGSRSPTRSWRRSRR